MQEVFYFGAGPATLPKLVLDKIHQEFVNYNDTGLCVLELSYRSKEFIKIRDHAEALLRKLLHIPDSYAVLFMHGGATSQFSMLPLNFIPKDGCADYVCTGYWSAKACNEAKKFAAIGEIDALDNSASLSITSSSTWQLNPRAEYVHYCDNETIHGVAFDQPPEIKNIPLVCDMTSSLLTRPIDINKFSLIYAGAQKNLGIAGLGVVIINKALLDNVNENVPRLYDYRRCEAARSLVNTPPIFAIYVLQLLLEWVNDEGGVQEIYRRAKARAALLYEVLDASHLFVNSVAKQFRSNVNITFKIEDIRKQELFLNQAESLKLLGLRGHRNAGGIRASLYNSMPIEGVQRLTRYMQDFETDNLQLSRITRKRENDI